MFQVACFKKTAIRLPHPLWTRSPNYRHDSWIVLEAWASRNGLWHKWQPVNPRREPTKWTGLIRDDLKALRKSCNQWFWVSVVLGFLHSPCFLAFSELGWLLWVVLCQENDDSPLCLPVIGPAVPKPSVKIRTSPLTACRTEKKD